ncbi:hypothetical protein M3Y99_01852300 [Aphelenchoides fujianensis]|nr:hypothetical protein M3Y99_01852300 [Aphelenchoides fujianensis]
MGVRTIKSETMVDVEDGNEVPKPDDSKDSTDERADGLADRTAANRGAGGDEAAEQKPSEPPPFVPIDRCVLACHEDLLKDSEDEDVDPACRCSALDKRPCASGSKCENRAMLVECHECRHGDRCHNQRFQRKKYARTEVRAAGAKGFGLFAAEDIPRGALILEFVGEVIDFLKFKSRMEAAASTGSHLYFMQRDAVTAIDATECGNSGRFINHSCEPNALTERWTIKDRLLDVRIRGEIQTKEITSKAIGFFAMRKIAAGEEIVYDYQLKGFGGYNQKCLCGAPTCRGFISTVAEPAASESSDGTPDGEAEVDEQSEEDEDEEEDEEEEEEQSSTEEDPSFDPSAPQPRPKRRSQPKKRKRANSTAADSEASEGEAPEADEPPVRRLQFAASEENRVWLNAYRIPKRPKVEPPAVVVEPPPAADRFGQSNGDEPPNPAVVEAAAPVDPFGDVGQLEDFKREPMELAGAPIEPVDSFADPAQSFKPTVASGEPIAAAGEPVDPFEEPADLPQVPKEPIDPFADPKEPVDPFEDSKMPVDPIAEPAGVDDRQSAVERWLEMPEADVQAPEPRLVDAPRMSPVRDREERPNERPEQRSTGDRRERSGSRRERSGERRTGRKKKSGRQRHKERLAREREAERFGEPPIQWRSFGRGSSTSPERPTDADAPKTPPMVDDRRDEPKGPKTPPGTPPRSPSPSDRSAPPSAVKYDGIPPVLSTSRPADARESPLKQARVSSPAQDRVSPRAEARRVSRRSPPRQPHARSPIRPPTRAAAPAARTRRSSPPTRSSPPPRTSSSRGSPPAPAAASSSSSSSSSSKDPRTKQDLLRAKFLQRKREVDAAASAKSPVPQPPPPQVAPPQIPGAPLPFVRSPLY